MADAAIGEEIYEREKAKTRQELVYNLENAISNMHREKPDTIFLTQTSSVPFGWAIKEAWKRAYPNEKIPKLLTIDVGELKYARKTGLLYDSSAESIKGSTEALKDNPEFDREVKSLEDKIQKYHIKKFVVFDESTPASGQSGYYARNKLRQTLFFVDKVITKAREDLKGSFETGKVYGVEDWSRGHNILPSGAKGPYSKAAVVKDRLTREEPPWRHARQPAKENPKVKVTIEFMKDVGRVIGEDLYAKEKRKKTFVETLVITFFLGAVIAYRMPLTGYAVSPLVSVGSNYIFAALLATLGILVFGALCFERGFKKA